MAASNAGATRLRNKLKFVGRRLLIVPFSIVLAIIVSFLLVALIPASTALAIVGQGGTKAEVAALNRKLGLNLPILTQLGHYLDRLAHLNFGTSFYNGKPVLSDMLSHLPATLDLIIPAAVLGVLLGVTFGVLSAYFAGRRVDNAVRVSMSVVQAVPEFLLGLLLLYVVFYRLGIAPAPTGQIGVAYLPPPHVTGLYVIDSLLAGDWTTLGDVLAHLALPVLTIAFPLAAVLSRIARSAVGDALAGQQIESARAIGLRERTVIRYALADARLAILTFCATVFAGLLGGDVIVEEIFNWNGIGQWGITAMTNLDVPQIQGFVLFTGICTLLIYIALDLLALTLDPRINFARGV